MSLLMVQLLLIGLAAGVAGGMFGIGGGAIMVPAMVLLLGMDQKFATGTSIAAQILPIGLLGAASITEKATSAFEMRSLLPLGCLSAFCLVRCLPINPLSAAL
jgi:uncharacterized membrane protein YfcA